ncbi:MAG: FAD-dependent oxidoreductase [Anaerolineae bacterium]|nr:FAD-dependent oxidoreductase [Anaerolineae bacterium]
MTTTTTLATQVLVIGGGSTGLGIARDLAKRGLRVTLAEEGDLRSGTSGRYHGLLHSGGRYAVKDTETARECIDENRALRKLMPHAIEDTGGLFVTTPADPPEYADVWRDACRAAGIPVEEITLDQARRREPALHPRISRAFLVPDASCDSFDALVSVALAAEADGATILTYHSVVGLLVEGDRVTGARAKDHRGGGELTIRAGFVVNATGPWAGRVAALAGIHVPMKNSRGALVALNFRWVNTVVNRLRPPGDGDIMVPVGTICALGTTSVPTDDPYDVRIEPWEVSRILEEAGHMAPGIEKTRALRAWAGVRPIYDPGTEDMGRAAKRTFSVLDHEARDGIAGMVSVVGGKLTTYRYMAEKAGDIVCAKLGISVPCSTRDEVLPPPAAAAHGRHVA